MIIRPDKNKERKIRARRQSDIKGTKDKPRLVVYRSLSNIYAQLVNDDKGDTIVSVNTLQSDVAKLIKGKDKKEASFIVGEQLAKEAIAKKIKACVFDRNGYIYHGRVQQVAEGARKGGLQF
ncbi:MAG: 50S ribosomal protein L18 [Christensenellaceae bacterium]|jgi:large subunit ribosomal protein L18|nr:50S ribosomal protein L18 [Christensenellaceae bacterium]